jgi:hypothetical protein
MHPRVKPAMPLARNNLRSVLLAQRPRAVHGLMSADLVESIKTHLGGETTLARVGAHAFILDRDDVTFRLFHENPAGVKTVVVKSEPEGRFRMKCFGALAKGALSAPLIAEADGIVPENLATVLGKLTGLDELHHRHF